MQEPPGGPPDFTPPVIVAVRPDSGAVLERMGGSARIQFDEVISERSGGGLANLVRLSPRPRELEVDWKRTAIEVRPAEGWRRGAVYHMTVLPGVQDLRDNRLDSGRTVIFAIGTAIPDTRLAGTVLDWEGGQPARNALIEAVLLPDSLTYVGRADSTGAYTILAVPRGTYMVFGTADQNTNGRRDARERYDSAAVTLDSAATQVFWAITQDTVGPSLRTVTHLDSVTIRIEFSHFLHPDSVGDVRIQVAALPDTVPVPVAAVWTPAVYDSVKTAEAAAAAAAAAAADTVPPDTAAQAPPQPPPAPRPVAEPADTTQPPDSTAAQRLLRTRPQLLQQLVLRLAQPMPAGGRYLVDARAASVTGAAGESRRLLVTPAPRDST